jgi:hypothetical protein
LVSDCRLTHPLSKRPQRWLVFGRHQGAARRREAGLLRRFGLCFVLRKEVSRLQPQALEALPGVILLAIPAFGVRQLGLAHQPTAAGPHELREREADDAGTRPRSLARSVSVTMIVTAIRSIRAAGGALGPWGGRATPGPAPGAFLAAPVARGNGFTLAASPTLFRRCRDSSYIGKKRVLVLHENVFLTHGNPDRARETMLTSRP